MPAKCHPEDLWESFHSIEEWCHQSDVFGFAGWVHGEPWVAGSRFVVEVMFPIRRDLEVTVLKCEAPHEVVMLSHGGGLAGEQWLRFVATGPDESEIRTEEALVGGTLEVRQAVIEQQLKEFFEHWFEGLRSQAEKLCFAL